MVLLYHSRQSRDKNAKNQSPDCIGIGKQSYSLLRHSSSVGDQLYVFVELSDRVLGVNNRNRVDLTR